MKMGCAALHIIFAMATGIAMAIGCPEHCICDKNALSALCSKVTNITWSKFIADIPANSRRLVIYESRYLEESPDQEVRDEVSFLQSFRALYDLKYLEVQNSSLVNLGNDAFNSTPNVKELHFKHVDLGNKTLNKMSVLTQVEIVELSDNHIEELPEALLESWSLVKHLNLQHNDISEFNYVVFQKASRLRTLDLSHNRIHFVHPLVESTDNRSMLELVSLHSNRLRYIHPSVLLNLTKPTVIHLGHNPWDCHCGMGWLTGFLMNQRLSNVQLSDAGQMRCETPEHLQSTQIMSLNATSLDCEEPYLHSNYTDVSILFLNEAVLECNVSGYPRPSVYWLTPRGAVVHPHNRYWVPQNVTLAPDHLLFTGRPLYLHASVRALADGSLLIYNFRYYFQGEYSCVAVNPSGSVSYSVNVTLVVNIKDNVFWSMLWGFVTSGLFLVVGIVYASISTCAKRFCCPKPKLPEVEPSLDDTTSDDYSDDSFYFDNSPCWSNRGSPRRSPKKCVTPAEGFDFDHRNLDTTVNIRETLESVRIRLRYNMERHVDKIRSRAQNMKKSSHKYMKNVRHTTGHYMKNIKHTSSQYVHKVRDGVVLGVEQVKYHVQSIKELCGTGDITHTISTVSISTDVDSQRREEVVKTVTFV